MKRLILGSASPRRADLMRQLELSFDIVPAQDKEPIPDTLVPSEYALESAVAKVRAVRSARLA